MTEYKAIETIYNGYRFRSRLEARWAVFFDTAGIRYEYEPEGFETTGYEEFYRYLPDFYFPDWDIYGEVKPSLEKLEEDEEKLSAMIDWDGPMAKGLLILGQIPANIGCAPVLYLLKHDKKCIARRHCTILSPKNSKTILVVEDEVAESAGYPDLPISKPDVASTLFCKLHYIEKDVICDGTPLMSFIPISIADGINSYVMRYPEKAYDAARQARFEYGETPKVTEGI